MSDARIDWFGRAPSQDDKARYQSKLSLIREKCERFEIPISISKTNRDWDTRLTISLPDGRARRDIHILDLEDADWLLSFEFEDFYFIPNYSAVCNFKQSLVISAIEATGSPSLYGGEDIVGALTGSRDKKERKRIILERDGITVSLGSVGNELSILTRLSWSAELQISGVPIRTADEAAAVLRKISDGLFLQVEAETGLTLVVSRTQRRSRRQLLGSRAEVPQYRFPNFQYDTDPMTLYWYGASAFQAPLMQFLAFYQVLEYYFGIYTDVTARRGIQVVIKSPGFNPDRESDLARVIGAARATVGRGMGTERTALRSTLRECVPETEMCRFITENKEREEFLTKNKVLKVTRLNLHPTSAEVVREVADRIYELRCRIVHTKGLDDERDLEPLLPHTVEEANMGFDIELARFCARQVTATSAAPLALP